MSEENVETVRRVFEWWEAGDFRGALPLFADELVTRRHAPLPDPTTWHGHDGLRAAAGAWFASFSEYAMKADKFIAAGAYVVVRVTEEGRGARSGASIRQTFPHVFGLRDRRVITLDWYARHDEALKSVGLEQ